MLDIFLNPDNHRISAQLEDVPSEIEQQLEDDTLSENAGRNKKILEEQMTALKNLKEQIKDLDQEQPGLIYYDEAYCLAGIQDTQQYMTEKETTIKEIMVT